MSNVVGIILGLATVPFGMALIFNGLGYSHVGTAKPSVCKMLIGTALVVGGLSLL
jgi:hypothetical protein